MEQKLKQELEEIVAANQDLKERVEGERWLISYNKKSDMIYVGTQFPEGTFYFPVDDSGFMVRIDKNKKVYGFAIENAKAFIKKNPEAEFVLSFFVYPIRSLVFKLPIYFMAYHISNAANLFMSNYVAGKAAFA